MKQRTLKLLAMCLALALLGGVAATAQTLVVEDATLEEPLLPEAALDIELPEFGDFGLALDDMVSGDLVSQDIAPGGGRDVAANGIVNSGVCGPNVQWTLDSDGLLTIYGSGDMDGYYSFWEKTYGIGIRRAVVQEGVTSLAINTFNGCEELETVSLPDSLENIYGGAFMACDRLTRVDIPYGVPWVAGYCFARCYSLSTVTIPESVTEVVDHAFDDCPRLTIRGYDGSYAETYARENGIPFISLGAAPVRPPRPAPRTSLANCKITVKDQVYTGKPITPAVQVVLDGRTLGAGSDYTVEYSDNVDIGTATVTVSGTGSYTGTAQATFRINPKAVSGLKLSAGQGLINVSWKKGSGSITGYKLQYGLKKSFSGAKTVSVKKASTLKKALKGLKKGKTYYVRIRAYRQVGATVYYSAWSGAKKAKVK